MTADTREDRLLSELESLRALKKASSILDFETSGNPPDRYHIKLAGLGMKRASNSRDSLEPIQHHEADLRLPYGFPERPPDIRWTTPIFHPNISFSGFLTLKDMGMRWTPETGLDLVCERLWDLARFAYLDLDQASNHAARRYYADQGELDLPYDHRPLRDRTIPTGTNIIRYERRPRAQTQDTGAASPPVAPSVPAQDGEIFFIGEDTPTPQIPVRIISERRRPRFGDGEVLYIGDD